MIKESSVELRAKQALANFDLSQFLTLLPLIRHDVEKFPLALQAAEVAFQKKDIATLQALAATYVTTDIAKNNMLSHELSYQTLLKTIFHYLIDLNAYDAAVGTIVFRISKAYRSSDAWHLLAQVFLANNLFEKLNDTIIYLTANARNTITETCLEQIAIQEKTNLWLYWFEQYAQSNEKIPEKLEALLVKKILTIQNLTQFFQNFKNIPNSNRKRQIIYRTFIEIMKSEDKSRTISMINAIPAELIWLKDFPKVLSGGANIALLAKLEPLDAAYFVKAATIIFIAMNSKLNDPDFYQSISQAAKDIPSQTNNILEIAIERLLENKRFALCLQLITVLEAYKRPKHILKLVEHPLETEQYQIILSSLEHLDSEQLYSDEDKIASKIPEKLLEIERNKRGQLIQEKISQEFGASPTVSQKHPKIQRYIELLNQLKRHKQYSLLLIACQKLTKSQT